MLMKFWISCSTVGGSRSKMNNVGPVMSTNRPRVMTKPIFVFDMMRMPRLTPEVAERMKSAVRMEMIATITPSPSRGLPVMIEVPVRICRAPMPREVAVPKRVTRTAKISMIFPATRLFGSVISGSKSEEISGRRPRRKAA